MGKCVIVMNDVALKAMDFSSQNDAVLTSHNFFFNTIFQKNLPPATSGVLLAISECGAEGGAQGTVAVSVTGAGAWKQKKSRYRVFHGIGNQEQGSCELILGFQKA